MLFLFSFFLTQGLAFSQVAFTQATLSPAHPLTLDQLDPNNPPVKILLQPPQPPQPPQLSELGGNFRREVLVEQGKAFYEAGQFSEAATVLQQAAAAFKTEGDVLKEAMTLSNISLVYQQLGSWSEAERAIADSLKLLQAGENVGKSTQGGTSERSQILAQTLDIQGRLQLSLGQPEQALNTWQQAAATYSQIGDRDGTTQSQINQAQAMENLGLYPRACKTLLKTLGIDNQDCKVSQKQLQTLKDKPDSRLKAVALRSLGDILQLVGDLKQSEEVLRQSLDVAQRVQSPLDISAARFSVGNTLRAQGNGNTEQTRTTTEEALKFYQQATDLSTPTTKIQAQINQLSLLVETKKFSEVQALWPKVQSQLAKLPLHKT